MDPEKTKAIREWPVPKDKHQLRSFLGLCTYYRRFVQGYANVAKPLTRLTEEGRAYLWTNESQMAFEQLKGVLTTSPILGYPNAHGDFVLDTDASNEGIGGVLSQVQDGQERVISYFSKTLSKPERNYCVTRRELLAIVKSLEHFYKYLYGRKFLLRTDHAALKWLLQFKNPEGQVARWIERLQEYDFNIEHRAGIRHGNADALSRRPCPDDCGHCKRAEEKDGFVRVTQVIDEVWQPAEVGKDQQEDADLKHLLEWKTNGQRPTWNQIAYSIPSLKVYWAQWDSIIIDDDGLLKRVLKNEDGTEGRKQLLIPKKRVAEVLGELHDKAAGGHLGVKKTLGKVRERFYWANLKVDVADWCRKCAVCAASNGPQRRPRAPMQQYNVGSPFERVAIDAAGPFPETEDGNKYIIVVMDYFSKWVEAYALPNQEAATVADVFIKEWICRFGAPNELHSDQGRNFESALFQEVCKTFNIRKTRTTPLHPQSDGMVERMNRTILRHLSKVVADHQRDWDQHLPLFLMAYRSSVHETTGHSPTSTVFGREIRLPCDLKFGCKPGEDLDGEDYISNLRRRLDEIHDRVRINIERASDRMKERYDVRANEGGYQTGDQVWLFNPQRKRGYSPKLQRSWEGPYQVLERINDVVYRIQKIPRGKPKVVHFNRLSPYEGDNHEEQVQRTRLDDSFEEFMTTYGESSGARFGVVNEVEGDLFNVPRRYALACCIAKDLRMNHGIARVFKSKFDEPRPQNYCETEVGDVFYLKHCDRRVLYLVTRGSSLDGATYQDIWKVLQRLRERLLTEGIFEVAIPRIACARDGLNWRVVRNMIEVTFKDTGIQFLVCNFNPDKSKEDRRMIDCYFFNTTGCTRGTACRFRHDFINRSGTKEVFRDGTHLRRG